MNSRAALVTGISGGIGSAIGELLRANGWYVIGLDREGSGSAHCDAFLQFDLRDCTDTAKLQEAVITPLSSLCAEQSITALINNAALQILSPLSDLRIEDWQDTLAVNVTAPMLLSQALLPHLAAEGASIVNIGSVHAKATKPAFVGYATSKGALHALTRSMAVDLGTRARVMCVAPAAISTPMLLSGFIGNETALAGLAACHPAGQLGMPQDVADAVLFLINSKTAFLTGTTFYLDGGVLSRLHDPV
jgi:meso-butanediol dehydrogenase / (S,S)-butanediol dehydrogenase / diacetyl reductase